MLEGFIKVGEGEVIYLEGLIYQKVYGSWWYLIFSKDKLFFEMENEEEVEGIVGAKVRKMIKYIVFGIG